MMDLDDLKEQWADLDRKLDVNIRLNRQLLNATRLTQTRSSMKRLSIYLGLELLLWVAIIVALGNFIYRTYFCATLGCVGNRVGRVLDRHGDSPGTPDFRRPAN